VPDGVVREWAVRPSTHERITFDDVYGPIKLDEIVLRDVSIHIEAMGKRSYCIIINQGDRELYLNARDVALFEASGFVGLDVAGEPTVPPEETS
jgi:hypothetical protein